VRDLLGEAVSAAVLLAATLKFQGNLTLQLQGDGAVSLLVAQCTHDFRLRAMARFDAANGDGADYDVRLASPALFRSLVGSGRLVVTIEAEERGAPRYQGVVPLDGRSLSECLESYFANSEQLPTRVRLCADGLRAAGILVQRMPIAGGHGTRDEDGLESAWADAERGIATLNPEWLLNEPAESTLEGLAGSHDIRLYSPHSVQFRCRCDRDRVSALLRGLGADEVRDVLQEEGAVTVTCEFCQRPYRFEATDVDRLFTGSDSPGRGTATLH
jgi:molecular chaperone Hsp33